MVVIGIVGRSGAGKSTVARVFASFGAEVLDVDQVARRVVEPGSQVLTRIGEEFGSQYLRDDGRLDRRRLGRLVFSDPEQLLKLNRITLTGSAILTISSHKSLSLVSTIIITHPALCTAFQYTVSIPQSQEKVKYTKRFFGIPEEPF